LLFAFVCQICHGLYPEINFEKVYSFLTSSQL
jgi:hypothetical protein